MPVPVVLRGLILFHACGSKEQFVKTNVHTSYYWITHRNVANLTQ